MTKPSEADRRAAYKRAREAREKLEQAAACLGYSNVHELARAARNGDFGRTEEYGVEGITNAHSYLNNGSIENLVDN